MLITLLHALPFEAASPGKYAASSVLSQGNWVKIEIKTPGLQTLSRQTLRNFGFTDPAKVFVYGYGGRMVSEALSVSQPDDLPAVPVVRGADGSITFHAAGNITIQANTSQAMQYSHFTNPYSDATYYFLSDRQPASETQVIDLSDTGGMTVATETVALLVHEQDLLQCAESGRDYLGEDFRSAKSQNFKFDLPDNTDGNAKIRVRFGASTSGAQSSIMVSANGQRLAATNSDKIAAVTNSDQYYNVATTTKNATDVGNSLTVGIEYTQGGVVNTARLDWIEVEYNRSLRMDDGQLNFTVNPKSATAYRISGASATTMIWDITDPADVKEVKGNFNSSDNTLTIGIADAGMREFIAFEPTVRGATVPGRIRVANQDIHAMEIPDMVIISPDAFTSAAERIAELHRQYDSMTVYVLTPEKIYNEFSGGKPDVSAFRKLLKMWYDRGAASPDGKKIGYCLLMGRPTYDQKRKNPETIKAGYSTTLIWQSSDGLSETTSYCTDDFIGMMEDEAKERGMAARTIDVAIGRYPVTSLADANIAADKLEAYLSVPDYGIWRNNVMMIADDGDTASHLNQAQKAIARMQSNEAGANYAYERLYLDAFELKNTGTGSEFPEAKQRMLNKWEKEGTAIISYIGHANPKEWGHEKLLTWNDINSMSNQHLPVLYAATCSFGKWDAESVSGAEVMLVNPAGGAISIITPSRTVYISRNESITNAISEEMTKRDIDGLGQRIGDILRLGKNNCSLRDDNMNRYHLFGDPALRMPTARYTVAIDTIAGLPLSDSLEDAPTVKARSTLKISGRVTDSLGNLIDFNGPVQYVLYDAEQSVTTNGWGESGVKSIYQDRSNKLATGSAMASSGTWEATILMPAEISNNYTPAFLSLYAYDESLGAEANGSTDRLYVYGYDHTSAEDTEGPEIHRFVINSDAFSDGDLVHANPVVLASFSDPSGINISDAGIGHKMTLMLDGDKMFDDLSNYYEPDTRTDGLGSITYPLTGITPGEHRLTLTVWDNANNSSSASLNFKVGINLKPEVSEFSASYNPSTDMISLSATTDRALAKLDCRFECISLSGNLLWSAQRNIYSGKENTISYQWDMKDSNGNRLPRGIYILRAYVTSDEGLQTTKSKKIAIPAK